MAEAQVGQEIVEVLSDSDQIANNTYVASTVVEVVSDSDQIVNTTYVASTVVEILSDFQSTYEYSTSDSIGFNDATIGYIGLAYLEAENVEVLSRITTSTAYLEAINIEVLAQYAIVHLQTVDDTIGFNENCGQVFDHDTDDTIGFNDHNFTRDYILTWTGRDRIPYHLKEYRVEISVDDVVINTYIIEANLSNLNVEWVYTRAMNESDNGTFESDITFIVYQVNTIDVVGSGVSVSSTPL